MPKPYEHNDSLSRRAQFQGYRARSVYKLQELDQKFQLFKPNQRVLDVGAAPGSWLQYLSQKVEQVTGIDVQPISPVADNVETIVGDIREIEEVGKKLNGQFFDLVVSDIAPSTTGIPGVDQAKSVELSRIVANLAEKFLKPKGTLVMKSFQGEDFGKFFKQLKGRYGFVTAYKAKASRDRSTEVYVVCQRKI